MFAFSVATSAQPFTNSVCGIEPSVDLTIGTSNTSVSNASNYFPFQSGIVVKINGTFVIDVSLFTFENCTLIMGTNAEIRVTGKSNFKGDGSNFFSCNYMWKGIKMLSQGRIELLGCVIQNALVAADFTNNKSYGLIDGCTFDRNDIGIQSTGIMLNVVMTGNTFTKNGLFLPIYGSNTIATLSTAGIRLSNSTATIGANPFLSRNTFFLQRVGILLEDGSNATIRNAAFNYNQTGIRTISGNLTLNNPNSPSTFLGNGAFDILSNASQIDVVGNTFYDSRRALRSLNNIAAEQIRFNGNQVWQRNTVPAGSDLVSITRSIAQFGTSNQVNFNYIHLFESGCRGIFTRGFAGTMDRMTIYGNHIYPSSGLSFIQGIEIDAQQADNFHLAYNWVHSQNSSNSASSRWGIYAHDGEGMGHYIGFNQVLGESDMDFGMCAMHNENLPNCTFTCNEVNKTLRGLHFMGDCNSSDLIRNRLNDHHAHGLLIQSIDFEPYEIGVQAYRGNVFACPTAPLFDEARIEPAYGVTPFPDDLQASQFLVNPTAPAEQMPDPVYPIAGWFRNDVPGQQNEECPHVQPPPPDPSPVPTPAAFSFFEKKTLESGSQTNAAAWDFSRSVMQKMLEKPALKTTHANAAKFFDEKLNSSAGLFAQFELDIEAAMQISVAANSALENISISQETLRIQLVQMENGLTISEMDSVWFEQRHAILEQLFALEGQRTAVKTGIQQDRLASFLELAAENEALPNTMVFEKSRIAYNSVRLRELSGDSLSMADTLSMIEIVETCPSVVGKTWGLARAYLPTELRPLYYIDQHDGGLNGCTGERSKTSANANTVLAVVTPNPAEESMIVSFEKRFSGRVVLTDMFGKIIENRSFAAVPNVIFDVRGLPSGSYFVSIVSQNGETTSQKLTVIH